jgi:hypothetical protein
MTWTDSDVAAYYRRLAGEGLPVPGQEILPEVKGKGRSVEVSRIENGRQRRFVMAQSVVALLEKAQPLIGQVLTARQVKEAFGYEPTTYIIDTKLVKWGIVHAEENRWRVVGRICNPPHHYLARAELAELPDWAKPTDDLTEARGFVAGAMMSEDDLLKCVIDMAHTFGWLVAHFRPAKTEKGWRTAVQGDVGFYDLVIARKGDVAFIELKSEKGKLTEGQKEWIEGMRPCGAPRHCDYLVFVFRPSDWLSGKIEQVLGW